MEDLKFQALYGLHEATKHLKNNLDDKGPYAKAAYHFQNNRDENLWVECLAYHYQDFNKAKSTYITTVAHHFIKKQEQQKLHKLARDQERERLQKESAIRAAEEQLIIKNTEAKANAKSSEHRWAKASTFLIIFFIVGMVLSARLIGFNTWYKILLVTLLAIPYSITGFITGHYLRCLLVQEYSKAYGRSYNIFKLYFIASAIYTITFSLLALKFS